MEVLGYLASIVMGVSLGMLGGGGSILTIPILVYLFGIDPSKATAYSLFIVGSTAIVGAYSYYREKQIDYKVGALFALPGFLGVFLVRYYGMPNIPNEIFQSGGFVLTKNMLILLVFSILMLLASFSMIRKKKPNRESEKQERTKSNFLVISAEGLLVGALTGFVGAGGGFLLIPALVHFGKLNMRLAVGTSLAIIAFKSLLGFVGDMMRMPNIDWMFLLSIAAISGVGIWLGSQWTKKVSEEKLKIGFGYFVLLMGLFILVEQFR